MAEQTGIVLTAFGSAHQSAQTAFNNIKAAVAAEFPEARLTIAFSSKMVLKRLRETGINVPDTASALHEMSQHQIKRIIVLPLHFCSGCEYEKVQATVKKFAAANSRIAVKTALPLLSSTCDVKKLCCAIKNYFPPRRSSSEGILLVAHGSRSNKDEQWLAAIAEVMRQTESSIFITTIEGARDFTAAAAELQCHKITSVTIFPLLIAAGSHVQQDLYGTGENSLKSILQQAGIAANPKFQGLGEYPEIAQLFIEHLKAVD